MSLCVIVKELKDEKDWFTYLKVPLLFIDQAENYKLS